METIKVHRSNFDKYKNLSPGAKLFALIMTPGDIRILYNILLRYSNDLHTDIKDLRKYVEKSYSLDVKEERLKSIKNIIYELKKLYPF